jgi:hypothetical protein
VLSQLQNRRHPKNRACHFATFRISILVDQSEDTASSSGDRDQDKTEEFDMLAYGLANWPQEVTQG